MKRLVMMMMLLATLALVGTGCSRIRNKWAADGGFLPSVLGGIEGDYVVVSQSGGRIMDVWKLRNVMVQSETGSDGWLFRDDSGNPIHIGGDVKVIRVESATLFDKYHEYHMEFEKLTYREKHFPQK